MESLYGRRLKLLEGTWVDFYMPEVVSHVSECEPEETGEKKTARATEPQVFVSI